jgi:outer membrane protein OmpA-like peptidoglycan-associated protein
MIALRPTLAAPSPSYPPRRPPKPWSRLRRACGAAAAGLALAACHPQLAGTQPEPTPYLGADAGASALDRDEDTIPDDRDQCPDDAEDLDGFADDDGCYDADNDRDGLEDQSDLCPGDPEDVDSFDDGDGCPDPDNDQDRIADGEDSCPNDAEVYNGTDDGDGCPDRGLVELRTAGVILSLERVYFADGSAALQPVSQPILDALAATLQGNPQIRLIEVGGHADRRGRDRGDLDLARRRAEAVVAFLVGRGVDPARLRTERYGASCPLDAGSGADARARNRRVELVILETDQGTVDRDQACRPPP